jgi:hypothetical protein
MGKGLVAPLQAEAVSIKRWIDLGTVLGGGLIWIVVAGWVLAKAGSALPKVAMKRLGLGSSR